jgi:hypothetical protein
MSLVASAMAMTLASGCGLFSNNELPDFGFEEGYFRWYQDEKQPLRRDRNYVSIRFWPHHDPAYIDSVLNAYGLINEFPQPSGIPDPLPNKVRVTRHPAEFYYTTCEDTTLQRLGNRSDVEYALPVFADEHGFDDLMLTNSLMFSFASHIEPERQSEILDSLVVADGIVIDVSRFTDMKTIRVPKAVGMLPYYLAHYYYSLPFFANVEHNFVYTPHR